MDFVAYFPEVITTVNIVINVLLDIFLHTHTFMLFKKKKKLLLHIALQNAFLLDMLETDFHVRTYKFFAFILIRAGLF